MANLNNKVLEFKRHFNITEDFRDDKVFKLDPRGNLITVWNNTDYYLTNRRNPTKFLSKSTMQYTLNYGVDFLRNLKIIAPKVPKVSKIKLKPKPEVLTLEEQLEDFKKFHNIPEDATLQADLTLVDDKLSVKRRGKWVPLYSNKKPLANSTLQAKYGTKFLKDLSIPTVKHQKLELVQLPFNQFKYDKDFKSSLDDFHLNKSSVDQPKTLELEQLKSPIGSYLKSYQMIIPLQFKDPILLFKQVKPIFEETLKNNLHSLRSLKYSVGLESIFVKDSLDSSSLPTFTDPPVRFYTEQKAILNEDDIDLSKEFSKLVVRIENFVQNGSGWKLNTLKTLWLDIAKYEPIKGSSYLPLPDALKNKQAVVNIKNDDEHCLRHCLRAALFPAKNNINKVSSYPTEDGLNFEGIISPTPLSQITKVETLNNLAINVYGWENNKVIIHRISNQPHNVKRINTLIVEQDSKTHYVWVKHFNRLLGSKDEKQMFHCERCLIGFTRNDLLEDHLIDCRGINERAVRIQMPTPNNKSIKFVNHKNQLKAPWVIYADFESIIKKIEGPLLSTDKSFTHKSSIQEACGFCLRVVRSDGFSTEPFLYRGEDCIQVFLEELKEAEVVILESLKNRNKRYSLTPKEKQDYNNADTCWICGEQGFDNSNKKICLGQEAYCLKCAVELTDDYEVCSE